MTKFFLPRNLILQIFLVTIFSTAFCFSVAHAGVSDISNISYSNISADVSIQTTSPEGFFFKPDGTKLYVAGFQQGKIFQYTLATPWDLSTATYDSKSYSVSSQGSPAKVFVENNGTKMYVMSFYNNTMYQYTLSTPWDVTSASYDNVNKYYGSQEGRAYGSMFDPDGTKMYIIGNYTHTGVYQYTLSTPWDLSTATYDNKIYSTASQAQFPVGGTFSSDGTKMFITSNSYNHKIYQYNLGTAWDVSTASYSSLSFDTGSQDTTPWDLALSSDGSAMYMLGQTNKRAFEYTLSDTTAPTISVIASSTSQTTATITWTTNENSSSTVSYGISSSYTNASTSDSLVTSHTINLTGLATSTIYHFQVSSADASGNVATSSDLTFTTSNPPLSVVYANSLIGDDTTGDGTSQNPYKTFTKAYAETSAGNTIDLTGTFDWSNSDESSSTSVAGFTIDKNITIEGQGATSTFVQASSTRGTADRSVFTVNSGVNVTIENLTIRYGNTTTSGTGGGITNNGTLTLKQVTVEDNNADIGSNYEAAGGISSTDSSVLTISTSTIADNYLNEQLYGAGGIYIQANNVVFTMNASTISGNMATSTNPTAYAYDYSEPAGAISIHGADTVVITNSTITGNHTNSYAGAITTHRPGNMTITNSTIVGNTADEGAGGILYTEDISQTMAIKNTILANNTGNGVEDDFYAFDTSGTYVTDNGYNIIGSSTGVTWSGTGDITGIKPNLNISSSLGNNNSTNGVQTLALQSGSLAINAGDVSTSNNGITIPSVDQRGFLRNGVTDIGAFEYAGYASVADIPVVNNNTSPSSVSVTSRQSSVSSSGGYVSLAQLAKILAPSASTTAYLAMRARQNEPSGCPVGYICKTQSIPAISTTTSKYIYPRDLKIGITGKDVYYLQVYLNNHGYKLADSGPGSPGSETQVYGSLTKDAVIKYQKANHISPAVGYFGPITRGVVESGS